MKKNLLTVYKKACAPTPADQCRPVLNKLGFILNIKLSCNDQKFIMVTPDRELFFTILNFLGK